MEAAIFTFSEQKRRSSFPEVSSLHVTTFLSHVLSNSRTRTVGARLLLSHQRDLQIGGPVFRLVKSTTVHVFAPIKKHAVVDVDEVIVHVRLSLDQAKQRKGFSCDVLHDIDLPLVETICWKFVGNIGKSLMQCSHLIRFISDVVQVVRALCNRVRSLPGVVPLTR